MQVNRYNHKRQLSKQKGDKLMGGEPPKWVVHTHRDTLHFFVLPPVLQEMEIDFLHSFEQKFSHLQNCLILSLLVFLSDG